MNRVIYFSQSLLLLAKTNEDRTASRKALYHSSPPLKVCTALVSSLTWESLPHGWTDGASQAGQVYIVCWRGSLRYGISIEGFLKPLGTMLSVMLERFHREGGGSLGPHDAENW